MKMWNWPSSALGEREIHGAKSQILKLEMMQRDMTGRDRSRHLKKLETENRQHEKLCD